MSINAIDSQIMINRTSEFSKETSVQQKRNETVQDLLAVQEQVMTERDQQKVVKSGEAEDAKLNLTGEGKGTDSGGSHHSGKKRKQAENEPSTVTLVPPEEYILNIKI